ncbi:MAG TPA: glycoside hydrolase family 15 protein [Bryobacteraceae bacterium]|nr:glycoside hydrolase family 15 protein [Bryobacteraceae bacterium]
MTTKVQADEEAPGRPGTDPLWTSSAKTAVGTAANPTSQVWFTIGEGVLNEIYWPEVDRPCTRDLQFIVTDGKEFFSEEKRNTKHTVAYLASGVPAYRLTNECQEGRYRIEKEIITDPRLDVLLMRTKFLALGTEELFLYVLLAPHLADQGAHNHASIEHFWGRDYPVARRDQSALALGCSTPFLECSAGYVGFSDGWQDLQQHKRMEWKYPRACDGNVALIARIDLRRSGGEFVLALGFDSSPIGAAHHVRASLLDGFAAARDEYIEGWQNWQDACKAQHETTGELDHFRVSTAVLQTHQAKKFPGGAVASLSIPWGFSKGDNDRGGYHVAWVRDAAQVSSAFLAAGCRDRAIQALRFLAVTQEADGSWPQNMWLRGARYWSGRQMDESALPILLTAQALREKVIDQAELERLWPMVRKALCFIVQHGPATQQDRWEEVGGYSPYTIATEIAALLEAAEFSLEPDFAEFLRETADTWNENIERWTYATGTDLAKECGVEGYYVRIAPVAEDGTSLLDGAVQLKNMSERTSVPAGSIVSIDALALVRFGLRAADDPRILNTVRVIDSLLKVETPHGPCWHRYNRDGYGEHADGAPFDGTGIGRVWPLLTGERAHYELAAGRPEEACRLMHAMEAFTSEGGMIPEQIWDTKDIPARHLFFGRPSGSGMPLVWAHAEYIKLSRSIRDGLIFDMPPQCAARYLKKKTASPRGAWRFTRQIRTLMPGKSLRLEVCAAARVRWSANGWCTVSETSTRDTGLGLHIADLPTGALAEGTTIRFTFYWIEAGSWEGTDFSITINR